MFPEHLKGLVTARNKVSFDADAVADVVINSDVKELKPDSMDLSESNLNIFRDKSVEVTKVFACVEKDEMSSYKVQDDYLNYTKKFEFYYFEESTVDSEEVEWKSRKFVTDTNNPYDAQYGKWQDIK